MNNKNILPNHDRSSISNGMKKISYFFATTVLVASFVTPLNSAMAAGLCNAAAENDCASTGKVCNPSTGACVSPTQTSGSGAINPKYLQDYKTSIIWVINVILLPVLVAVAFIVFLWGVYKYFILGASNESEKAEGRKFAMWGIIGFVIIFSVWSLVNLVRITLSLPNNNPPATPTL